jgi:hypothetical protein
VEPTAAVAQRQLGFMDQTPWREEVIRPLGRCADRTAQQRAQETAPPPDPVRPLPRRCRQRGRLGLLPAGVEVVPRRRASPIPDAIRQEIDRLNALDAGVHARDLARLLRVKTGSPLDDKPLQTLWQPSPVSWQGPLGLWNSPRPPDRDQARLQGMQLASRGRAQGSIRRVLQVSRPTVAAWIRRCEAEPFTGLVGRSRAPQAPVRKIGRPRLGQGSPPQKAPPDAGRFRLWSLLARSDLSERTVGRLMALHKRRDADSPPVPRQGGRRVPGLHPDNASHPREDWVIDGRQLDGRGDGVKWWSLIILEGDSRTIRAGALAPTAATWGALMVLDTACRRSGVPHPLVSDRGGASTANDVEAVGARRQIRHEPMERTQGEREQTLRATPVTIQRRLSDEPCSLTTTPLALAPRPQAFTYNPTAQQGRRTERGTPPGPRQGLGAATGRGSTEEELSRRLDHHLCPRRPPRYGGVTLHRDHFALEEGFPSTQGLRWVSGEQCRATVEPVGRAESRCHDEWRERPVAGMREGVFSPTRLAAPPGPLLPWTPQEFMVG